MKEVDPLVRTDGKRMEDAGKSDFARQQPNHFDLRMAQSINLLADQPTHLAIHNSLGKLRMVHAVYRGDHFIIILLFSLSLFPLLIFSSSSRPLFHRHQFISFFLAQCFTVSPSYTTWRLCYHAFMSFNLSLNVCLMLR